MRLSQPEPMSGRPLRDEGGLGQRWTNNVTPLRRGKIKYARRKKKDPDFQVAPRKATLGWAGSGEKFLGEKAEGIGGGDHTLNTRRTYAPLLTLSFQRQILQNFPLLKTRC